MMIPGSLLWMLQRRYVSLNLKNVLFDLLRPFEITNNYTGCSQLIRAIQMQKSSPQPHLHAI